MAGHPRPTCRTALRLAACACAVIVVGCGGGASFESQANRICRTLNAKLNAIPRPTTQSQVPAFFDAFTPLVQQGTAQLRALKPPSDKASGYHAYLSVLDQQARLAQQAGADAHAGKLQQAAAISQQGSALSSQGRADAKALGLSDCTKT